MEAVLKERARVYVSINEGRREWVYRDHLGNRTIGVGFNLERPDAAARIAGLGLDFNAVLGGQTPLSEEQIDALLDDDLESAAAAAGRLIPDFDQLVVDRAVVVIDMIFNLGEAGFSAFRNCIAAINQEDWERAAQEIGNSRYATQVPNRAQRNIWAMRQGSLPNLPPLETESAPLSGGGDWVYPGV